MKPIYYIVNRAMFRRAKHALAHALTHNADFIEVWETKAGRRLDVRSVQAQVEFDAWLSERAEMVASYARKVDGRYHVCFSKMNVRSILGVT